MRRELKVRVKYCWTCQRWILINPELGSARLRAMGIYEKHETLQEFIEGIVISFI